MSFLSNAKLAESLTCSPHFEKENMFNALLHFVTHYYNKHLLFRSWFMSSDI